MSIAKSNREKNVKEKSSAIINRQKSNSSDSSQFYENLSSPIVIISPELIIKYLNPAAEDYYSLNRDKLIGRCCRDEFKCGLLNENLYCPVAQILSCGECFHIKTPHHFGVDESYMKVIPLKNDNGEITEICLEDYSKLIRLKTREIKLQDDLKKANEFLHNLVNGSPNSIIASDFKGNTILFSERAEKLLGYTAEYAKKNLNIRDIYTPGYAEELMKKLRSEEHGGIGKMEAVEAIFLDIHKNQIPCSLSAYLIFDKDGKEEALVCIFYDLRARKLMKKELEETQMKLFQSEKMSSLGKLAAGIAHEINNPLGGIMIFAESMLEDLDENNPHREDLKRIASEAKRCKNIVKGLLEFSRQTGNTMILQNINELLEQGMFILENQAIFHNIDVVKEYDNDIPFIKCDSARLKQVFINITQNAIDAMGAKGTFTIKTRYNKQKKRAEIEFSDTGCGIPNEIRQKIFDPFFSTKEVGKGTGLGLSMSYGIIKDHGGTISIKSKEGNGATFMIELPIES